MCELQYLEYEEHLKMPELYTYPSIVVLEISNEPFGFFLPNNTHIETIEKF